MKNFYPLIIFTFILLFSNCAISQEVLPKGLSDQEREILEEYFTNRNHERGIPSPPPFDNLRTMAEWEEIQTLTITWTSYRSILKQIVVAAKEECEVLILCENSTAVINYLNGPQGGGAIDNINNISFLETGFNSIWIRDYAANTIYANGVDSLMLVDWIYNRPRPLDDASPEAVADYMSLNLYTTTAEPSDLVNTGGNFMVDGMGTAFASELILEENEPGNPYQVTPKTEEEIDNIMFDFMGIERFIKMETLPYDLIHHIDMHMKLLDEETLLVGEYPANTADGPQINANIEYVLSNFNSVWEEPYIIKRIPMPDSESGAYPDNSGHYRTYTNGVFVNKTYIYPSYREEYDSTAYRMYQELLPGYTLVPIDSDNSPEAIIAASGAIHCITHSIGVADPLLINHQRLKNTENTQSPYEALAYISHRSGIDNALLHYRLSGGVDFIALEMENIEEDANLWSVNIPAQEAGSVVEYYIEATSNSGKNINRPLTAPEGFYSFEILGNSTGINDYEYRALMKPFPNPASAITCVPVNLKSSTSGKLVLRSITGKLIDVLHEGTFPVGEQKYFLHANRYSAGAYLISLESKNMNWTQKLMIQ